MFPKFCCMWELPGLLLKILKPRLQAEQLNQNIMRPVVGLTELSFRHCFPHRLTLNWYLNVFVLNKDEKIYIKLYWYILKYILIVLSRNFILTLLIFQIKTVNSVSLQLSTAQELCSMMFYFFKEETREPESSW